MNTPLAQEYTLVLHNPDPTRFVCGPGLRRLKTNCWLATVPVVPHDELRPTTSQTHICRSHDNGQSWQTAATLPYYNATPWIYDGNLYLFAMKGAVSPRNEDLLLLRSDDDGKSWSDPVTIFKGYPWNCHTGMVIRDGRLYWAVDDLSFGKFRGPRVVTGDLSRDPMHPGAWWFSNPVPFPGVPDMAKDVCMRGTYASWLEPNVIEVEGRLRVLATVRQNGLCAVFDVRDDGRDVRLEFTQYHAMPGGNFKFFVFHDAPSGLFWATSNQMANSQELLDWSRLRPEKDAYKGGDRRLLMLSYSLDGLNWFTAGCVARAATLKQSFNYATPMVDGDDLGIIARSSINGPNPHDADCATFHRVSKFRELALNLWPD